MSISKSTESIQRESIRFAARTAAMLAAAITLACASQTSDSDDERTGSIEQRADWQFSSPGMLGLGLVWAGPATSTGSDVTLADFATDGVAFDKSGLGKNATGIPVSGQGNEEEELIGSGDFNGDGQTDLLWRAFLTGKLTIWEMSGHQVTRRIASASGAAPFFFSGYATGHIADLNGDGISDIVWTGAIGSPSSLTNRALTWIMRAGSTTPAQTSISDSTTTAVIAVGNFDGDAVACGARLCGRADLLKHAIRGDGTVTLATASGTTRQIATVAGSSGWKVRAVGDFNGDSFADAFWYNTISGEVRIWEGRSDGTMVIQPVFATVPPSSGWTIVGTAQTASFGRSDILWQHRANRVTSLWKMRSSTQADFMPSIAFQPNSTLTGIMNIAEPPAPTELSYTISGSTATVKVKNNNWIKNNTGTTRIEVYAMGANGWLALGGWNATSTGFKTNAFPLSHLPMGANTCLNATVSYHGRVSLYSNLICKAGAASAPMQPTMPLPDARPNLGLPDGVRICTPDLTNCSFLPRVNQPFVVLWRLCNNGASSAGSSTTRVVANLNGSMSFQDFAVGTLPSAACVEQHTGQLSATSQQDVFFDVVADAMNSVAETYEGDNWAGIGGTVWP